MSKEHHYQIKNVWTGNQGNGTVSYQAYSRDHVLKVEGKADLLSSADPSFRGDPKRHNPEELLVASLSSCHMLWYLHLCAVNNVVILSYEDKAHGIMTETSDGGGKFREVILNPIVIVKSDEMIKKAIELHEEANKKCFIANSCNFPIIHNPLVQVKG